MKVAVVGESASGLLAALELAHRGAEVNLFEEHEPNSGEKRLKRLLIVTSKIAEEKAIKEIGLFQDESLVRNRIGCFELLANGSIARIELRQPDLVIEREDLFQALREKARAAGVKFFYRHRFKRFASFLPGEESFSAEVIRNQENHRPSAWARNDPENSSNTFKKENLNEKRKKGSSRSNGPRMKEIDGSKNFDQRLVVVVEDVATSREKISDQNLVFARGNALLFLAYSRVERKRSFGANRRGKRGRPLRSAKVPGADEILGPSIRRRLGSML